MDAAAPAPEPEFGPDPKATEEADKAEQSEEKGKKKRSIKIGDGLGNNKKRNSGVRALTNKDKEKLIGVYVTAGMFITPLKPDAGYAIGNSAEECANAWFELAETNDNVRKTVLMLVEGGAWGRVMAAHLPIIMALIPANALPFNLPNNDTSEDDMKDNLAAFMKENGNDA